MAQINDDYLKLPGSYLFADIAHKVNAFKENHPEMELIRLGIGDVTRPLPPSVIKALHKAVDEQATAEGFRGYGPEQGYRFLREAIAQGDFASRGVEIDPDDIFVSDGAKCDLGNFQELFGRGNVIAVTDPVYPVYVDSNVMGGRAGTFDGKGSWSGIVYLPCSAENGFVPSLPLKRPDVIYLCLPNNPTAVPASAYHNGWARGGDIKTSATPYGLPLELKHNGAEELGGPLFWAHYSYIGLDPRKIKDRYADYWNVVRNHALSDYRYCVENPKKYKGYGENCWGLTASYSVKGYAAHCPGENDLGVITPTAALSSFPYTPEESMRALKYFYSKGDSIWGTYGFYDAFSETDNWTVPHYLAIDQCTIAPMIENYRSGLLWNLFMSCPEIQAGLKNLGFEVKK